MLGCGRRIVVAGVVLCVGGLLSSGAPYAHAVAYTFVDLTPDSPVDCYGSGIGGGQEVGTNGGGAHAALWSGTSTNAVSL